MMRALVLAIALALATPGCSTTDNDVGKMDVQQVEAAYLVASGILRDASVIAQVNGLISGEQLLKVYEELNRADKLANEGNFALARFIYFQVQGKAPPEVVRIAEDNAGTTIAEQIGTEGVE
jgi:hypothetical protein